jgi:hypothetical protein
LGVDNKKFETLYRRLFNIAYNSNSITIQDKSNQKAVLIAVDIYNSYNFKDYSGATTNLRWHLESPISCNQAKNNYICENNSNHKITKGDYYGNLYSDASRFNPGKLCLSCLAKIIIIVITKFPPSEYPIEYKVNIDFDLNDIE